MTPQEFAKQQRDFLIRTDKQSAVLLIDEFEKIKRDVSFFLLQNLDEKEVPENLKVKNFLERTLLFVENQFEASSLQFSNIVARAQRRAINFASKSLKAFIKPEIKTSIFSPDKEAVQKLIGRTQSGSSLTKFFQTLKKPIAEKARETLIEGFAAGESNPQIAKRLNDVADVGRWRAMTIARTETNEAYRAATRDFYEEGEIPEYVWMSVLDPRTCLICWHLHGRRFKSDKKVFSHPNCRCVLVPYTGQKIKTGAEIFAGLEAGLQKQILGNTRFDLYSKGAVLNDFVGRAETEEFGKKHFIKPLYELEARSPEKAGAGGNWHRLNEKFDPAIVKQTSGTSCVSAVGEMLLKHRGIDIPQKVILDIIGEPADAASLANVLNRFDTNSKDGFIWRGIVTDENSLDVVLKQKNIGVFLIDDFVQNKMLHAVFVEGQTKNGLIRIKDPFDQTKYKMTRKDFIYYWGGQVILRWYP